MADNDEQAEPAEETQLPLEGPGDRLRLAREKADLTIEQVAAKTRIPQRQLVLIEAGKFEELPGRTYATGFSRNFAKAVGVDADQIATEVLEYLGGSNFHAPIAEDSFEPGDPARVPSRGLAWFGLFAAGILIAGLFVFYNTIFAPGSGPASILSGDEEVQIAQADGQGDAALAPAINPDGAVVFTAIRDDVWVKFYDGTGERLLEKQMALGETYTVPPDAVRPLVWTGWPAALTITIDGKDVPKLSEEDRVMKDIEVSAEALLARDEPVAAAIGAAETSNNAQI